ncbi:uncharacterized [Tachysurus ichikawai]
MEAAGEKAQCSVRINHLVSAGEWREKSPELTKPSPAACSGKNSITTRDESFKPPDLRFSRVPDHMTSKHKLLRFTEADYLTQRRRFNTTLSSMRSHQELMLSLAIHTPVNVGGAY